MTTTQIPHYLNSADHRRIEEEDVNNFTFSRIENNDNPEKVKDHNHQQELTKQKVEKICPLNQPNLQSKEGENVDGNVQQREKEFQTPKKEQIEVIQVSPQFKSKTQRNNDSQNEQSESRGYQQLTMKLQTALNKIAGSKKLNKTTSQSNNIWNRSEQCAQRKKKDLQRKREQSEQMKKKEIKSKPVINKNSQKIVRQVGYKPIYDRYQKIIEEKKKRQREIEQEKKRQKEEQEQRFMEELNQHMRRPQKVRNYTQYFDQMVKWKEQSDKQNRQKLEIKKNKELDGVTFKPTINSKSKKMVASQNRLPIDQRGLVKDKSKKDYSFRPNISRKVGK